MAVTTVAGVGVSAAPATDAAHDAFHAGLTARNRGLIDEREQRLLRQARILVAGSGWTPSSRCPARWW